MRHCFGITRRTPHFCQDNLGQSGVSWRASDSAQGASLGHASDDFEDGMTVDAEMVVKIGDGSGLAKMLDTEANGFLAVDRA